MTQKLQIKLPFLFNINQLITYFLILFMGLSSFAQNVNPFQLPASIPIPSWINKVDWNKPNVREIGKLIAEYKKSEEYMLSKKLNEQKNTNDYYKQEVEEPYETAFIRWEMKMRMEQAIEFDGKIKIDNEKLKQKLKDDLLKQSAQTKSASMSNGNWTSLGPIETFGSNNFGPADIQVNIYTFAIAPSNPNIIYCGTEPGGIFKTTDKGLTWHSVWDNIPAQQTQSIAIDYTNANIVYGKFGNNILKTTNGGISWNLLTGYTGGSGEKIIILEATGRIITIGTTDVFYSDDNGTTWLQSVGVSSCTQLYDIHNMAGNSDTIYVSGRTSSYTLKLFRSVDGGANFSDVTGLNAAIKNSGSRFGVSLNNKNIIYCVALGHDEPPKILKSTDAGFSWSVIVSSTSTDLGGSNTTVGLGMSNGQGYYDLDMMVDPNNINNVIVGTTSIYKSLDGGFNFSPLGGYAGGPINMHVDVQCMRAIGNEAFISSDGGFLYSSDFFSDNNNSDARINGITGSAYWGFGQGWQEDITTGGRYHNGNDAMFSDNYGFGNSLAMGGGESGTGHVFPGRERTVGHNDIGVSKIPTSLAGGIQYNVNQNVLWPETDYYYKFHGTFFFHPSYRDVFYIGRDSILWKSTNAGNSYAALKNFGANDKVWRFDMARSNTNVMYVLTENGIYKTIDAGINWIALSLPVNYSFYNADIAVNPENENEVYICMANASANEKIFKSTNGGNSWINYTGSVTAGKYISSILFQGGTDGGIYASTLDDTKVYYRDNTMADWIDYSTGIFLNHDISSPPIIFYRDNKLRLPGNRGIMETPLYSQGNPIAHAMSSLEFLGCEKDTVEFYDYSILNYSGATWQWTFPGASWISSTSVKNPKVLYANPGNYDVTLKVTDALGKISTKTFPNMIKFEASYCSTDTVIGKCLNLSSAFPNKDINIGTVNINSNTFSISTWVKPNGKQKSFSQIIGHYGCPGSPNYGIGYGITYANYAPNLELCYTDNQVIYFNDSGLQLDTNAWNNIVLTYSPTGVKLYLNGVAANLNNNTMPALDLSLTPFYLNPDLHHQGGAFNGLIDEVKIYNYTLSQNEVREKMHLIQNNPNLETGLVKYIQFNKLQENPYCVYDIIDGYKTLIVPNSITTSTAPVSTGTVFRNNSVNSGGLNSFPAAHVDMHLPATGTYPNGEMVAFHLRSNPDQNPDTRAIVPGYFIINNYGSNETFSSPDSLIFSSLKIPPSLYQASDFKLFKRNNFAFGPTWGNEIDSAASLVFIDTLNSVLKWSSLSGINSMSQFVVVNGSALSTSIKNTPLQNTSSVSLLYPNPTRENFYIEIDAIKSNTAQFNIYDIKGILVYSVSQNVQKGKNKIMVMLPKLAEGIYDVNISLINDVIINKKLTIL